MPFYEPLQASVPSTLRAPGSPLGRPLSLEGAPNNYTDSRTHLAFLFPPLAHPILSLSSSFLYSFHFFTNEGVWRQNRTENKHPQEREGSAEFRTRTRRPAGQQTAASRLLAGRGPPTTRQRPTFLRPSLRALSRTAAAISVRSSSTTAGNVTTGEATAMALPPAAVSDWAAEAPSLPTQGLLAPVGGGAARRRCVYLRHRVDGRQGCRFLVRHCPTNAQGLSASGFGWSCSARPCTGF